MEVLEEDMEVQEETVPTELIQPLYKGHIDMKTWVLNSGIAGSKEYFKW